MLPIVLCLLLSVVATGHYFGPPWNAYGAPFYPNLIAPLLQPHIHHSPARPHIPGHYHLPPQVHMRSIQVHYPPSFPSRGHPGGHFGRGPTSSPYQLSPNVQPRLELFPVPGKPVSQMHALDTDHHLWIDDGNGGRMEAGKQQSRIGLSKYRNGLTTEGDWKLIGKDRIYGQRHEKKRKPFHSTYFGFSIYDGSDYSSEGLQRKMRLRSQPGARKGLAEYFGDWDAAVYDTDGWTLLKQPYKKSKRMDKKRVKVAYTHDNARDDCAKLPRNLWKSTKCPRKRRVAGHHTRYGRRPLQRYEIIEEKYTEDELEDTYAGDYVLLDSNDDVVTGHSRDYYHYV